MITNLPIKFPLDKLDDFIFGDVEANNDELLEHDLCVCKIRPINEFLKGRKNIIIGERGTGKTALFRLLRDGKIHFVEKSGYEQIVLAIDEDLQFKAINELVNSKINITSKKECLKYRFVWEVFLLYRIAVCYEQSCTNNKKAKNAIDTIKEVFGGLKKQASIFDVLLSQKKTVGCKVDQSSTQIPIPDFYLSVESSGTGVSNEENKELFALINIEQYKQLLNECLGEQNTILYVMIDKLDEFVLKEEYEIQKKIIQGLLFVERSYNRFSNIKLKIFLRSDIFKKLNFDELGYEKVSSRKVDLTWSHEDIREFLARRIVFNYFNIFELDYLEIDVEKERLYIDETSLSHLDALKYSSSVHSSKADKIIKFIGKALNRDSYGMRKTNFNDEINREIITSIFPRKIPHKDVSGSDRDISIFEYLSTHFNMSSGKTTPRLILMYLEICFEKTREYYEKNADIQELKLENNEYPLIKKPLLSVAYFNLQNQIWDAVSKVSQTWENWINILRNKKKQGEMKYSFMESAINGNSEEELKQFLAFMTHLGILECKNWELPHDQRIYTLPILFKKAFKP
jgi:hypothetical protein